MTKINQPYKSCNRCSLYGIARADVLAPAFADRILHHGETYPEVLDRLMIGVHARHLAGLPILPGEVAR